MLDRSFIVLFDRNNYIFSFSFLKDSCSFSQLNIVGIDGPKISASINPTLKPSLLRPTATFDDIVDFPTPPFPEVIAIIFFILSTLNFVFL